MEHVKHQDGPGIYCTFWLDQHCFAVPSSTIREIQHAVPWTPVPGTHDTICGYVNLRGQLYLVMNPDSLLLGRSARISIERDLIVFRQEVGESFAIVVDAIGDITTITEDQYHVQITDLNPKDRMDPAHSSSGLIKGHATLAKQLVTLVDPHLFPLLGMNQESSLATESGLNS